VPAFQEKLHVGRPNIGNRERLLERINQLLDRKWLTNGGPFEQEFEERVLPYWVSGIVSPSVAARLHWRLLFERVA